MKSTKTVQGYKDTAAQKNRSTLENVKTNFDRPIGVKEQNPKNTPNEGVNSPWDFRCPEYDQRNSNFISAGTHYGVGIRQPVGHTGNPKAIVNALPRHRHNTLQDDDKG